MPANLRVGIIGTGGIANAHLHAFLEVDNVDVVGVWNRTRSRADEFVAGLPEKRPDRPDLANLCVFDSWHALIEDDIDIVCVVTAPQLRSEPIIAALEKGIHVLVEKPFANNIEEAEQMVAAASASKSVTAVNFCHRYRVRNRLIRNLIQADKIGDVRNYHCVWRFLLPPTFGPKDRRFMIESIGGLGFLGELASHQFDMFTFLTGKSIHKVTGSLSWAEEDNPELRANMAYNVIGMCDDGTRMAFEHTAPPGSVGGLYWSVHIGGSKGYLESAGVADNQITIRLENDKETSEVTSDDTIRDMPVTTAGLAADFVDQIRTGKAKPFLPTFEDGLNSLRVLMATLEADRRGSWVEVEEMGG